MATDYPPLLIFLDHNSRAFITHGSIELFSAAYRCGLQAWYQEQGGNTRAQASMPGKEATLPQQAQPIKWPPRGQVIIFVASGWDRVPSEHMWQTWGGTDPVEDVLTLPIWSGRLINGDDNGWPPKVNCFIQTSFNVPLQDQNSAFS